MLLRRWGAAARGYPNGTIKNGSGLIDELYQIVRGNSRVVSTSGIITTGVGVERKSLSIGVAVGQGILFGRGMFECRKRCAHPFHG
jgi:hypothetical protein